MASQEHIEKMQARQNFRNLWHTDLMRTIQADTPCKEFLTFSFSFTFPISLFIFILMSSQLLIFRRLLLRAVVVCDLELSSI